MKLYKICKAFFNKIFVKKVEIPLSVSDDEILVRCIGHELYYSLKKERLASTAFMPPSGSNEVSLLRLRYSNADVCKKHAKSIKKNNYTYCGLSLTFAGTFLEAPQKSSHETYHDGTPIIVKIAATPLDEKKEKRNVDKIYTSDAGLPFHADLIYNWTPTKGQTAPTVIKKIARYLSKNPQTFYFPDKNIQHENWCGDELIIQV